MATKISGRKFAANLIISLAAQAVSIITSFVLGFIVPKFIDEYQYSYWQIYVLYVGYTGVFQFGLLDGLVLRYSQYNYDEIDKPRVRSQFNILLAFNAVCTIAGCLISSFFIDSHVTAVIVVLVSVGITVKNIFGYTSYTFQITNRITQYAGLIIVQRATYALIVIILLACGVNDFYWYCIADLLGDAFCSFVWSFFNRGMYFGKIYPAAEAFKECWRNVSSGMMLMVANFSSILLISAAKMFVQWNWDELVFGQVSFSFSVSNVFLTFVTALSVVLFPSLKRMNEGDLPEVYKKIRNAVSMLLFFVMIFYFPGCWILEIWLPNYSESLVFLGVLLPLIIFSAKVNLLTNNYLKAYRRERTMLVINIISVLVGIVLFAVGAYVLCNLDFILYSVVAVIIAHSVCSEIIVSLIIKKNMTADFIIEIAITVVFVVSVRLLTRWWACLAYGCALVVYFVIYHRSLAELFGNIGRLFAGKKNS